MMTILEYNNHMWSYYLQLETDFLNTLKYVEFAEDNFGVYSKEYAIQLLSICSEIDVVFKKLCEKIDFNHKRENIVDYSQILSNFDGLTTTKVKFKYNSLEYLPFENWSTDTTLFWWKDYNCVKHHRLDDDNNKKANLKNVFYALAALFLLNRFYCKTICANKRMKEPVVKSKLFEVVGWESCIPVGNGFVQVLRTNGNIGLIYDG